jgi:hypothetical protein
MYQNGPESFMVQMGIPYERLRDDELGKPEVLARYDLLWFSGPQSRLDEIWRAVHGFVRGGKTAILEKMGEGRVIHAYPYTPEEKELMPQGRLADTQCSQPRRGGPLRVRGAGSALFAGLEENAEVYEDVWVSALPGPPPGGETHGEILDGRASRLGVALTKSRFGEGTVWALALPLGNISMWRGTRFDSVGRRVLRQAVGDRYAPLYEDFAWKPAPAGRVHFADDFMREAGEGSAWRVEKGAFRLTGGPPPPPPRYSRAQRPPGPKHAFTLQGMEPGRAATGSPDWRAYRLSLSVLADEGEGGLWLSTSAGRRLSLQYDGQVGRLNLYAQSGEETKLLQSAPAAAPAAGWRRLSLLARDGVWQAWIDGENAIRVPARDEEAEGRFGIAHGRGTAYYDDIRARDTDVLIPGTDLCLGEEGSCRSDQPNRIGLDRKSTRLNSSHRYISRMPSSA